MARIFLSVRVTIDTFDPSSLNLTDFLLEQKKAVKKLWGIFGFLLGLTVLTAIIYWFTHNSVFLVSSALGAFTLPLVYFPGLHRRSRVIDRLFTE